MRTRRESKWRRSVEGEGRGRKCGLEEDEKKREGYKEEDMKKSESGK